MNRAVGVGMGIGWFLFVLGATVIISLRAGVAESLGFFVLGSILSLVILFVLVPKLPPMRRQSYGDTYNIGTINYYVLSAQQEAAQPPSIDMLLIEEERLIKQLIAQKEKLILPPPERIKGEIVINLPARQD